MLELLDRLDGNVDESGCTCQPIEDGWTIDATDCDGRLSRSPTCRATAVDALAGRSDGTLRIRSAGVERVYEGRGVALLGAAGRFAELVEDRDQAIAKRARCDPLGAARAAVARASSVSDIAAETGLAEAVEGIGEYDSALRPAVAPTIVGARIETLPPENATLRSATELSNGGDVRIYDRPEDGVATYHIEPVEIGFDRSTFAVLERAYDWLAEQGRDENGPVRAIRAVLDETDASYEALEVPMRSLADVLEKHTRGYGIFEDLFADPAVSDVYASAPAAKNQLWIVRDGESMRTNVRLSEEGAAAVASRLRRESGRSFSRATPTLDATATLNTGRARVAGIADPATDGLAFAFRSASSEAFTLPALVENGTITAEAAGLLSTAVRRDAAGLVAGTRGAGKTTLLGALLWELSATTRTITIEDTPELPVKVLQSCGRDVQPIHTTLEDGPGISPDEALRTALRLGDSALVLGEVRGEEAAVLYEAMRVGASGSTVLGTIHGDGGADVRERVVSDLDVPESSFSTTDLLVTVEPYVTSDGERARRVRRIEEVIGDDPVRFEPLYAIEGEELVPTGQINRGNSHLIERLARPNESYADVRARVADRGQLIQGLADSGETDPQAVTSAYARWDG